jgi:hypothetical protein
MLACQVFCRHFTLDGMGHGRKAELTFPFGSYLTKQWTP